MFHRLQDRAGDKVIRTTASSLHEFAKILRPDQVESELIPIYNYLRQLEDDVREKLYEHFDDILENLDPELAWKLYIDVADSWKNNTLGGWRVRERIALHFPALLKIFRHQPDLDRVLDMFASAVIDPFAAVRDAVTEGVPKAYLILEHGTEHAARLRSILVDLGNSSSYRQRMT